MNIIDKRGHERVKLNGYAVFNHTPQVNITIRAGLKEISLGGFSVSSGKPIEPEEVVKFEISSCLTYKSIFGTGKIKHVSIPENSHSPGYKIGVEFLTVNQETLMQLINALQPNLS